MSKIANVTSALLVSSLLSACGGGGSGATDSAPPIIRADPKIWFLPQNPSLLTDPGDFPIESNSPYFAPLDIKITDENGLSAPNNTVVELKVSNVIVASIGIPDDTSTPSIGQNWPCGVGFAIFLKS